MSQFGTIYKHEILDTNEHFIDTVPAFLRWEIPALVVPLRIDFSFEAYTTNATEPSKITVALEPPTGYGDELGNIPFARFEVNTTSYSKYSVTCQWSFATKRLGGDYGHNRLATFKQGAADCYWAIPQPTKYVCLMVASQYGDTYIKNVNIKIWGFRIDTLG